MAKAEAKSGKVDRLTVPVIIGRAVNTSIFTVTNEKGEPVKESDGKTNKVLNSVLLFRCTGTLRETKHGHGDKGPWTQLIGDFGAINAKGVKLTSDKLFLPDAATDLLVNALNESKVGSVDFALQVSLVRDKNSGAGFVYAIQPLLKPTDAAGVAKLFAEYLKLPDAPAAAPKTK